jgi:hypothetical protein
LLRGLTIRLGMHQPKRAAPTSFQLFYYWVCFVLWIREHPSSEVTHHLGICGESQEF